MEDDAVLVAAHTMLKGMFQIHDSTIALLLPHEEFVDLLGSPHAVDLFEETTRRGAHSSKGDHEVSFSAASKDPGPNSLQISVTVPSLSRPRD